MRTHQKERGDRRDKSTGLWREKKKYARAATLCAGVASRVNAAEEVSAVRATKGGAA